MKPLLWYGSANAGLADGTAYHGPYMSSTYYIPVSIEPSWQSTEDSNDNFTGGIFWPVVNTMSWVKPSVRGPFWER